jgi:hypothetical protein
MNEPGRTGNIIFCVGFIVILFGVFLFQIVRFSSEEIFPEKRSSKSRIHFDIRSPHDFVKDYQTWFNNHFFLRSFLIRTQNRLRFKIFNKSPVSKVILGRDNWLFQAKQNLSPEHPGYFSSIQPFTFNELEQWRIALEQRCQWLKKRNIFYLFIPVPDKSVIYPEFLPDFIKQFYAHSRLKQLVTHLQRYSDIAVLNLMDLFRSRKKDSLLYYKTDSHWNDFGAYLAYCRIITCLSSTFPMHVNIAPLGMSDFRIKRPMMRDGNLARMLAFQDKRLWERKVKLKPVIPGTWEKVPIPSELEVSGTLRPLIIERPLPAFPGTVMFHDSSGMALRPFLSNHFSRILFLRDWNFRFWVKVIEHEKPKILIDVIAEHFLYRRKLSNPQELIDTPD